jgi:hypothetical protein
VLVAGVIGFALTCLAITLGRPTEFHLGRIGVVSILRAPELFLPVIVAALSAGALWMFAKGRRGALLLLLVVLAFDLCLWGQTSGWRVASPKSDSELWRTPATVQLLRERATQDQLAGPYRILTQDRPFAPDKPVPSSAPGWVLALQPDIYMMYAQENAAGYDGFGLARYSRLAGDMKVWGELTDPERTLRGESREVDLLNVRYLLTRPLTVSNEPLSTATDFPAATQVYVGEHFGEENLNVPDIVAGEKLSFTIPTDAGVETNRIALLTNLAWSETLPDHAIVARIRLHAKNGQTFNFDLRAGDQTSEWSYDRPDIRSRIKHSRAPVAASYVVQEGETKYEAHTYVSSFALPRKTAITGGEITVERIPIAPRLSLSLARLTLADGERAFPLRSEWIRKELVTQSQEGITAGQGEAKSERWKRIAEVGKVAVFENTRLLPRAWLVTGEIVASDENELNIIRSGITPDGALWDPLEKALVASSTGVTFSREAQRGSAAVRRHEPNRVEVETESKAAALLVLSENHYPGWQAKVDGQAVEVIRVNYNQRGVVVPEGKHFVTFLYRPKSVLVGLVISLLTLAGLLLWWSRRR